MVEQAIENGAKKGMDDKLLLFKANDHRHLPTKEFPRKDYETQLARELPAYADFLLNHWAVPSKLKETGPERLGFKNYLNPEILDELSEASREVKLAEILARVLVGKKKMSGSAGDLYEQMVGFDSPVKIRLQNLCKNEQSFGHLISDLEKATKAGNNILGVSVVRRKSNGVRLVDLELKKGAE